MKRIPFYAVLLLVVAFGIEWVGQLQSEIRQSEREIRIIAAESRCIGLEGCLPPALYLGKEAEFGEGWKVSCIRIDSEERTIKPEPNCDPKEKVTSPPQEKP